MVHQAADAEQSVPTWKRDLTVGLLVGLLVLLMTWWLDREAAGRQEVLENVRFVRQSASVSDVARPFNGIDLKDARLAGLDLSCPILGGDYCANFVNANLSGADLSSADLSGAELTNADLSNADLTFTTFAGALLQGADLRGANLTEANFSNAQLPDADLAGATLTDLCYNDATVWPEGFTPPAMEVRKTCRPKPRPQPLPTPRQSTGE